jgi:carbamoyl-phosphate synthase small subunit
LVRKRRSIGALRGVISSVITDDAELVDAAKKSPSMLGRDLVKEVIPDGPSTWEESLSEWWEAAGLNSETDRPLVVAMDFGMK